MECDYLHIRRLLEKEKIGGSLRTQQGEYPVVFAVEANEEYLQEIRHLYEVFVSNGIPWQTVNAPYLYKYIALSDAVTGGDYGGRWDGTDTAGYGGVYAVGA